MYSAIYWLTRLDAIHGVFVAILFITGVLWVLAVLVYPILADILDDDSLLTKKGMKRMLKGSLIAAAFAAIGLVFLPTRNEAILIYAGGKAYEYVQKDTSLAKIPFKTTEYLKVVLEKEIEEVKKEK